MGFSSDFYWKKKYFQKPTSMRIIHQTERRVDHGPDGETFDVLPWRKKLDVPIVAGWSISGKIPSINGLYRYNYHRPTTDYYYNHV